MGDIELKLAAAGAQALHLAGEMRVTAAQVATRDSGLGKRLEASLVELGRCGDQLQMMGTEWHGRS